MRMQCSSSVCILFDHASELPYTFQHCHVTVLQLSGGQKARVALARAAYAGAHVCLLDDPLSAVDPRVSRILFNQCIGKEGIMRVSGNTPAIQAEDCLLFQIACA
jgi:ABC-type transport system involved in cytochrome c biogenesis ATPase subunit